MGIRDFGGGRGFLRQLHPARIFAKQEFNIDIRGLDGALQGLKISEILGMVRMEVVNMKDWKVFDDVYIAAFSFARYQMWQDLRHNMDVFSKNELISSLLHNRCEIRGHRGRGVQGGRVPAHPDPHAPARRLFAVGGGGAFADGQDLRFARSSGTGKSQTITNMIANALNDGKRVLFVAEKQAALSVVKKRLDSLGLGEFCLELHSNKTNKADVLQKLTSTLALRGGAGEREPVREIGQHFPAEKRSRRAAGGAA